MVSFSNHLWFLKTLRAKANGSAEHSKVETSTGLFVLLMIDPAHKQTYRRRLAEEQNSCEEEIRIYPATA